MRWGSDPNSFLNAGNVWSHGGSMPSPAPPAGTLWVNVACDILNLNIHTGTDEVMPFANVAEAGTCEFTLRDNLRKYDPMNPDSPYMYGGLSRLSQGTAIRVFVETLATPSTVTQTNLFVGTVDTWAEDWENNPANRVAHVVASDVTKELQNLDWGEQPPVGDGENLTNRLNRILNYYGYTGPKQLDGGAMKYQATTLAQSAWELLGRTVTDDNGYLLVNGNGAVQQTYEGRWLIRNPTLTMTVGCGVSVTGAYDIVLDVEVGTSEIQNSVTAGRTGGTLTTYRNATSVAQYGERGAPKRTDLTLYDDTNVGTYANSILGTRAFPTGRITSVTLRPQLEPACWPSVFRSQAYLSMEAIRILWQPSDSSTVYDVKGRPFGVEHTISRTTWDVRYPLALANVYTRVMHWGQHAYDNLDQANVYV
jgi:hypothetical protein